MELESRVKQVLQETLRSRVPDLRGFSVQIIGNILLLKLPRQLRLTEDLKREIVKKALEIHKFQAIARLVRISEATRKPEIELLYGNSTKTIHREAGVLYVVDVAKVMFSRLNKKERERMASLGSPSETVVDMFAGIGYFTLPIAKNVARVYAIDINPDSIELLIEAMEANRLSNIVPILCDNRKLLLENVADRIIMGYLFETENYLHAAARFCKDKCIVHFHRIFSSDLSRKEIAEVAKKWFLEYFKEARVLEVRKIKNYAPRKIHYVVDVECKK